MLARLRGAALIVLVALPALARAQIGGSVVVASDERFRGISLTDERPSLRLSLSYDHPSGGYAGVSLSAVELDPGPRRASLQGYAGYSGEIDDQRRWEGGVTVTHVAADSKYDYAEAYAGLGGESWNLRLYLAPDYFGSGIGALYTELDGAFVLAPDWRLAAHLGALRRSDGGGGTRFDARLGIVLRALAADWQLAWVGITRGGPFPLPYDQHRSRFVASVAVAF